MSIKSVSKALVGDFGCILFPGKLRIIPAIHASISAAAFALSLLCELTTSPFSVWKKTLVSTWLLIRIKTTLF